MNDYISRQAAIDALNSLQKFSLIDSNEYLHGVGVRLKFAVQKLEQLPSVQSIECRKQGEWDMFELITTAWYGKQYYFKEENDMAYSRKSHKTMTVHDAILEFIREIGDE